LRGDVFFIKFSKLAFFLITVLVFVVHYPPNQWFLAGLTVHTPLTNSDAIVLLAGSYKERVPAAAMLYRKGYAPRVILTNDGLFSSWSTKYNRNLYQIEWAEEALIKLGVPREKIIKLPYYGRATMTEALAVKKFLLKSRLNKIIIVTSDFHTRRAFWIFKRTLKVYSSNITIFPARSIDVSTKEIVVEYAKNVYYVLIYGLLGLEPDAHEIALKLP